MNRSQVRIVAALITEDPDIMDSEAIIVEELLLANINEDVQAVINWLKKKGLTTDKAIDVIKKNKNKLIAAGLISLAGIGGYSAGGSGIEKPEQNNIAQSIDSNQSKIQQNETIGNVLNRSRGRRIKISEKKFNNGSSVEVTAQDSTLYVIYMSPSKSGNARMINQKTMMAKAREIMNSIVGNRPGIGVTFKTIRGVDGAVATYSKEQENSATQITNTQPILYQN